MSKVDTRKLINKFKPSSEMSKEHKPDKESRTKSGVKFRYKRGNNKR